MRLPIIISALAVLFTLPTVRAEICVPAPIHDKKGVTLPQELPKDWIIEKDLDAGIPGKNYLLLVLRRKEGSGARSMQFGVSMAGKSIPKRRLAALMVNRLDVTRAFGQRSTFAKAFGINGQAEILRIWQELSTVRSAKHLGDVGNVGQSAEFRDGVVKLSGYGTTPRVGPLVDDVGPSDRIVVLMTFDFQREPGAAEDKGWGMLSVYPTEQVWLSTPFKSEKVETGQLRLLDLAGTEHKIADFTVPPQQSKVFCVSGVPSGYRLFLNFP